MNFTRIKSDDLAQCERAFLDVFNNAPWNESWEAGAVARRMDDIYRTPGFTGLLCTIDGEAVGFALGIIEQWDKSRVFTLKEMCVVSAQQRCGVGAALMNALEKHLRNEGVPKIVLHTARETPAQSFYEKQDFTVSAKMIMMSKWLNAE